MPGLDNKKATRAERAENFSTWEKLVEKGVGDRAWKSTVGSAIKRVKVVGAGKETSASEWKSPPRNLYDVVVSHGVKKGKSAPQKRKRSLSRRAIDLKSGPANDWPLAQIALEAAEAWKRSQKEREVRVLYYFRLAEKAFGDRKAAQRFMSRTHPKFGVSPLEKLDTEWGGRQVEQVLNSIMYGLPA